MERVKAKLTEVSELKQQLTPEEIHKRILSGTWVTCNQALDTVALCESSNPGTAPMNAKFVEGSFKQFK